jgi:uncharacterized tellurite resistance protein B-like protein
MLESLRSFFARHAAPPPSGTSADEATQRLHVAACALLLEMAHADGVLGRGTRAHRARACQLVRACQEKVKELIAVAEAARSEAVDLHQFTSLILRHYDEGQRYVLAELLWRVVLADGELSRYEDALLIKLGRLLDLRPGYLAGIKKQNP